MIHEWVCCRDEATSHQLPIAEVFLLNHPNISHGGMFKLDTKFDADSLLYSLSHFEFDSHTVHMFTQQRLPSPLTSTVRSSLFTHVHSSPLSLAARLHWCHTNCYHINDGWSFSGQTSYIKFGNIREGKQLKGLNVVSLGEKVK